MSEKLCIQKVSLGWGIFKQKMHLYKVHKNIRS